MKTPPLEYCSPVWDPQREILSFGETTTVINKLCQGDHHRKVSVKNMISNFRWQSLDKRRVMAHLTHIYISLFTVTQFELLAKWTPLKSHFPSVILVPPVYPEWRSLLSFLSRFASVKTIISGLSQLHIPTIVNLSHY